MTDDSFVSQINKCSIEFLQVSGIDEVLTRFCLLCLEYENEIFRSFAAFKENPRRFLYECDDMNKTARKLLDYMNSRIMLRKHKDIDTVTKKLLCVYTAKKYLNIKEKYKDCELPNIYYRE